MKKKTASWDAPVEIFSLGKKKIIKPIEGSL